MSPFSDTPGDLAVEHVRTLAPYVPGKPIDELERELGIRNIIKLASNENPFGPSPLALAAMQRALADSWLYPDGSGHVLKQKLAAKLGVRPTRSRWAMVRTMRWCCWPRRFSSPVSRRCIRSTPSPSIRSPSRPPAPPVLRCRRCGPESTMALGHDLAAMAARHQRRARAWCSSRILTIPPAPGCRRPSWRHSSPRVPPM